MVGNFVIQSIDRSSAGITVYIAPGGGSSAGDPLFMSAELWKEMNYRAGDTITEKDYLAIREQESLSRCISRAMKILSSSDHSVNQLKKKLQEYDFSEETVEKALSYVVEKGYVNENQQAMRLTENYIRHKFWGKKRIIAELLMRGYGKESVIYALSRVSEKAYMRSLHALLDRKYSLIESEDDKNRLFASLFRFGYSLSEIERAVADLESGTLEE
ncbi:MAG: RecX family transcriptional regulator [Clostridia bacterium]|nr:RecX family transcriptional regulator [Clostridia bacterium]